MISFGSACPAGFRPGCTDENVVSGCRPGVLGKTYIQSCVCGRILWSWTIIAKLMLAGSCQAWIIRNSTHRLYCSKILWHCKMRHFVRGMLRHNGYFQGLITLACLCLDANCSRAWTTFCRLAPKARIRF